LMLRIWRCSTRSSRSRWEREVRRRRPKLRCAALTERRALRHLACGTAQLGSHTCQRIACPSARRLPSLSRKNAPRSPLPLLG
jgi:hypothetical protein